MRAAAPRAGLARSPRRPRLGNQRSRSPSQHYGVTTGAPGPARKVRRGDCSVDGFPGAGPGRCGRVGAVFALQIQNWWWTALPAAH
ncbi:trp operon leader peptide [Streptomyces bauhiniae]|uniref:Trp operon leader peptide n=1 Tax=Streptomyces bauhiniae TaxID=2340725 RepID=A0A4Z1D917_9ACTN|nr:trp operon leader peptide [Streptomyces bauhiniae]